jgi:hypothetical protein
MKMLRSTIVIALTLAIACSGCGKKPGTAIEEGYRAYEAALASGDMTAIADALTGSVKEELAGPDIAMKLELIKAMRPTDIQIGEIFVTNTAATMLVTGAQMGRVAKGEVRMAKEGDAWKVVKEEWSMDMSVEVADPSPGPIEVKPFLPDPAKPPQAQATLEGHQDEVSRLTFTRDGARLVSASYGDYSLRLWNPVSGSQLGEVHTDNRVRGLATTPDGKSILAADAYMQITAWPLEADVIGTAVPMMEEAGDEIAISPDGKLIAVTAYNKPVTIRNRTNGTVVATLKDSEKIRVLAFTPKGNALVGAGDGNTYTVWDTKKWKGKTRTINKISADCSATGVDVSRDGKYMAAGFTDSSIVMFDLDLGEEIHNFFVRDASTAAVAFSPDGALLATANKDAIYLWNTRTAVTTAKLTGHAGNVTALAFSPDGTTLASGDAVRKIMLWRCGPPPAGAVVAAKAAAPKAAAVQAGPSLDMPGIKNCVRNQTANQGTLGWKIDGEATADADAGNPCFAIKYNGMLWQDARIPADAAYMLLVARASSERVDEDGDQTGLPYLYGNWVNSEDPNRFNGYLTDDSMKLGGVKPNQWGIVWGIFPVPSNTAAVRLFLDIADGGKPQNGSIGRFDDVAIFAVASESAGQQLLATYRSKAGSIAVAKAKAPAPAIAPKAPAGKIATPAAAQAPKTPQAAVAPDGVIGFDSYVGRTIDEVKSKLGFPKMQMKKGSRMILVYDRREISASDGVTVDKDEAQ